MNPEDDTVSLSDVFSSEDMAEFDRQMAEIDAMGDETSAVVIVDDASGCAKH